MRGARTGGGTARRRFSNPVGAAVVALWLLCGCAEQPARAPSAGLDPGLITELSARYPASREHLATTDGAIYLGNLQARIDALRADTARAAEASTHGALANTLLQRFRIVGRIEDAEQAERESALAVAAAPDSAEAWLMRASALSVFHRFGEARAAIDRAEKLGAGPVAPLVERVRRDLDVAEGRYERLGEELARSAEPVADFYELAHRADLRVLLGDLDGASRLYRAAQDLFVDTSPAQLSWLYVQQGIALLRFDQVEDARRFFDNAHQRLPAYALATEHLAECEYRLGHLDAARELYRAVIEQTGNPEYVAALADVESAAGNRKTATDLQQRADAGYRDLLARHRAGYAQHFAEFLLKHHQPAEALALAQENADLRSDVGSLILLARAASAAGNVALGCAARGRAMKTGTQPPEIKKLSEIADCERRATKSASL